MLVREFSQIQSNLLTMMRTAVVLLILFLWRVASHEDEHIEKIVVITRHGARYPLTKFSHDLSEGTEGRLTTTGRKQMEKLGIWLRDRNPEVFENYNPERVSVQSSAFDRTLVSAQSLLRGLYPSAVVPIFTVKNENDIVLRAYDKCPTFHDDLQTLYKSDAWQTLERENQDLLGELAQYAPFQDFVENGRIPLRDLWNVYDLLLVAGTECAVQCPTYLQDVDQLDNIDREAVSTLTHTIELAKFVGTGSRIGGNLLSDIVAQWKDHDVMVYSAHFPTLLGVMEALGVDIPTSIPEYASALVGEVYRKPGDRLFIKWFYRDGEQVLVSLRVPQCGSECSLDEFRSLVGSLESERWCEQCQNTQADVCLRRQESSSRSVTATRYWLGGVAVGYLLAVATVFLLRNHILRRCCQKSTNESTSPEVLKASTTLT